MTEKLPDSSMAEKWLDPDTFIYKGKTYRVTGGYWTRGNCSPLIVKEASPDRHTAGEGEHNG